MKRSTRSSLAPYLLVLLAVGCDPGGSSPDAVDAAVPDAAVPERTICGLGPDAGLPQIPTNAEGGCVPQPLTTSGTIKGQYGTALVCAGPQQYYLQVNEWNSTAPQTISYGGDTAFKVTEQQGKAATNGGPTGYPCLFIGANSGHSTGCSNLPKQVSTLTTVPTTWSWNDRGTMADPTTNVYNAAYDVWFSIGPEGDPSDFSPSGGFLMVWLYDPPSAQPIGSVAPENRGITIEGVSGTWDVWTGYNGSKPCISYVRTEPSLTLSFDLNRFIRDAVENRPGTIEDSWYLTNVFAGFEIWSGGVGLESTSFCAVVP